MRFLDEKSMLTELKCGENFSYILNENELFHSTEYKVLQGQSDKGFVKCMKMQLNGKIQLLFMPKGYQSITSVLGKLNEFAFINVIANLLSTVIYVKQIGFLSCQNIDLSFEHIYVNTATYKVGLIYLPLKIAMYSNPYGNFDNEFRTSLSNLIAMTPFADTPKIMKLKDALLDSSKNLDAIFRNMDGIIESRQPNAETLLADMIITMPEPKEKKLHIFALNDPLGCDIEVNKDEFLLGKDTSSVDGAILFNKMISRRHCKVVKSGTEYRIKDLNSTNGTYVNSVRVNGDETYPIKDGDVIRLANSDFQVKFR